MSSVGIWRNVSAFVRGNIFMLAQNSIANKAGLPSLEIALIIRRPEKVRPSSRRRFRSINHVQIFRTTRKAFLDFFNLFQILHQKANRQTFPWLSAMQPRHFLESAIRKVSYLSENNGHYKLSFNNNSNRNSNNSKNSNSNSRQR